MLDCGLDRFRRGVRLSAMPVSHIPIDNTHARNLPGSTPPYRALLRSTQQVSYSMNGFRDLYGDAIAIEVVIIAPKRVKELLEAGDLDPDGLEAIGEVREQHALVLVPR